MSNSQGITALLDAEREAQKIVQKARDYRTSRVKEARSEASKDVETYKAKQEAEFKEWEESNKGDTTSSQEQVDKATAEQLEALQTSFGKNKDQVIDMLLAKVVEVEPKLHQNYKAAKHAQ